MRAVATIILCFAMQTVALAQQDKIDCYPIYKSLKAYQLNPSPTRARQLSSLLPLNNAYCIEDKNIAYDDFNTTTVLLELFTAGLPTLKKQMLKGDPASIDLAFRWLLMTDAYYAEELLQTIGQIITKQPKAFLKSASISPPAAAALDIYTFVGDTYNYDNAAECRELKRRIKAIARVSDKKLAAIRSQALLSLKKEIAKYCTGSKESIETNAE